MQVTPRAQREVRFDLSKNSVHCLPQAEAEDAWLARKPQMRPAPRTDELWDGKALREVELTPHQLLQEQFLQGLAINKQSGISLPSNNKRKQSDKEEKDGFERDEWGTYSFTEEEAIKLV